MTVYPYKRPAFAITALRNQLNKAYPKRDRASDGILGDARHAASKSEHNPNSLGIVRAFDIDVDGIPAAVIAENIRRKGAAGDKRLNPGGYVILNRRIAAADHGWVWRVYKGSDPHTSHIHISLGSLRSGYDLVASWTGIIPAGTKPSTKADPLVTVGYNNNRKSQTVLNIQNALVKHGLLRAERVNGIYGHETELAIMRLQSMFELPADGRTGALTWRALRSPRLRRL